MPESKVLLAIIPLYPGVFGGIVLLASVDQAQIRTGYDDGFRACPVRVCEEDIRRVEVDRIIVPERRLKDRRGEVYGLVVRSLYKLALVRLGLIEELVLRISNRCEVDQEPRDLSKHGNGFRSKFLYRLTWRAPHYCIMLSSLLARLDAAGAERTIKVDGLNGGEQKRSGCTTCGKAQDQNSATLGPYFLQTSLPVVYTLILRAASPLAIHQGHEVRAKVKRRALVPLTKWTGIHREAAL